MLPSPSLRMAPSSLVDCLPDDVWLSIFARLSVSATSCADTFNIRLTCKRFDALMRNPLVLAVASPEAVAVRAHAWSERAHQYLADCAAAGNVEAIYSLGMILFYCLVQRKAGVQLMARAAFENHASALHSLAVIQFNGSGGTRKDKDLRSGVALCARAAALGHVDAMRELGHCLQDGYGVNRSVSEGRRLLLEANAREAAAAVTTVPPSLLQIATAAATHKCKACAHAPLWCAANAASGSQCRSASWQQQSSATTDNNNSNSSNDNENPNGAPTEEDAKMEDPLAFPLDPESTAAAALAVDGPVAMALMEMRGGELGERSGGASGAAEPAPDLGGGAAEEEAQGGAQGSRGASSSSANSEANSLLERHPVYRLLGGVGCALLSDFGCNVPPAHPHAANRFLVEWYADGLPQGLRLCSHANCGRPETRRHEFRRCSACGTVNYCSRACQALDWKVRHKYDCMPVADWADAEDDDDADVDNDDVDIEDIEEA